MDWLLRIKWRLGLEDILGQKRKGKSMKRDGVPLQCKEQQWTNPESSWGFSPQRVSLLPQKKFLL